MKTLQLTQHDFDEIAPLVALQEKIDHINPKYVNTISDEIYKKQPLLLSLLLGYQHDISPEELDELMRVYFLIWEYFRGHHLVQARKIKDYQFNKIHDRNIQMLQYATEESSDQLMMLFKDDLQNLKSKALMTGILFRFTHRPTLLAMDVEIRGIILVGIKTLIECFETL